MRTPTSAPPSAVCFTGGGSRAYVAALGQLQALDELGLLGDVGYVAGVSGGAWACAARAYRYGKSSPTVATPLAEPAELDWPSMCAIDGAAPHGAVVRGDLAQRFYRALALGERPYAAWRSAIDVTILQPLGLPAGAGFTWDGESEDALRREYPALEGLALATCAKRSPYPLLGSALLGPASLTPFDPASRCFGFLEVTPHDVRVRGPTRHEYRRADGARAVWRLTPPRFGGRRGDLGTPPCRFPRAGGETGPPPAAGMFTLADALASSSFWPAAPLSTWGGGAANPVCRGARRALGEFWACEVPASAVGTREPEAEEAVPDAPEAARGGGGDGDAEEEEFLLADGGSVCNPPLPPLLARGVTRLLICFNVAEPLPPRAVWDPAAQPDAPPPDDFSEDLAALFGVRRRDGAPNAYKSLERNHCFERASFAQLVRGLQESEAAGRGAFATAELTTVRNDWWRIDPGVRVTVGLAYICRSSVWEAALPSRVRLALPPTSNAAGSVASAGEDGDGEGATPSGAWRQPARANPVELMASTLVDGARRALLAPQTTRLDDFPQYPLSRLRLSELEANALYQLSGWVLKQHAEKLDGLLGPST